MYDCIVVRRSYEEKPTRAPDNVLDAEGPLDGESDADVADVDELMEDVAGIVASNTHGDSSSGCQDGSRMEVDE